MTVFKSEKDYLDQQIKNHRAALKHFRKSKETFLQTRKLDFLGTSECISGYYEFIEDEIKKDMDEIRSKYQETSI